MSYVDITCLHGSASPLGKLLCVVLIVMLNAYYALMVTSLNPSVHLVPSLLMYLKSVGIRE
jgi:hypothetical protein